MYETKVGISVFESKLRPKLELAFVSLNLTFCRHFLRNGITTNGKYKYTYGIKYKKLLTIQYSCERYQLELSHFSL